MAEQKDITEAKGTYTGFIKVFKIGAVITVIIVTIVILIISR